MREKPFFGKMREHWSPRLSETKMCATVFIRESSACFSYISEWRLRMHKLGRLDTTINFKIV